MHKKIQYGHPYYGSNPEGERRLSEAKFVVMNDGRSLDLASMTPHTRLRAIQERMAEIQESRKNRGITGKELPRPTNTPAGPPVSKPQKAVEAQTQPVNQKKPVLSKSSTPKLEKKE